MFELIYKIEYFESNSEYYKFNNKLRTCFSDKIWLKFTISLFNQHLQRGTTPPSLFYEKFQTPNLPRDPNFVENYNNIIENTQKEIIKLCINCLSNKVENIENELSETKNHLLKFFDENELDCKFDQLEKKEENFLQARMRKSTEKFDRIFTRKFEPLKRNINFRNKMIEFYHFVSEINFRFGQFHSLKGFISAQF